MSEYVRSDDIVLPPELDDTEYSILDSYMSHYNLTECDERYQGVTESMIIEDRLRRLINYIKTESGRLQAQDKPTLYEAFLNRNEDARIAAEAKGFIVDKELKAMADKDYFAGLQGKLAGFVDGADEDFKKEFEKTWNERTKEN